NVSLPGLNTGVGVCCGCGPESPPKTLTWYAAPTYTLPLATVGTANFTAGPGSSRLGFWLLEYKSVATFSASCAIKMADPCALLSIVQTIPLALPFAYDDSSFLAGLDQQVLRPAAGLIGQHEHAARPRILVVGGQGLLVEWCERIRDGRHPVRQIQSHQVVAIVHAVRVRRRRVERAVARRDEQPSIRLVDRVHHVGRQSRARHPDPRRASVGG